MSNIAEGAGRTRPPYIAASILFLIGLALIIGGAKLVLLGGSPYFVITGAAVLIAGALYWKGNRWGERLYALVLLGSLVWALDEAWGNPWALVARLFAPAVLGILISLPVVRRGLANVKPTMLQSGALHGAFVILVVLGISFFQASTEPEKLPTEIGPSFAAADSDWANFGNTLHGSHFAPLTQITPDNVADLQVAWTYRSGDVSQKNFSEATPLKVNDLLYTCSPRGLVIAIDARTGQERWRFDPKADIGKQPVLNCRGVSYYRQPGATGVCAERIFATSVDGLFHALDARDGKPCENFGRNGAVSLFDGLGEVTPAIYFNTSPPAIAGGVAVIGALVRDSLSTDMPSGVVRAYDVVTGQLRWAWDVGAPERIGAPPPGETYTRSTPNAWTVFAADEELGLVYVPTGGASSADLFGGLRRPFDEQYGSALVALNLSDGRPKWSFQTTHHDLWDFDNPAQPVLADIPVADLGGGIITPVVIQATKRGEIFVLDRRTGKPVVPVKEKDVPQDPVEGDWTSKTQPFSELSFAPPRLTETDMWGLTPLDMMVCRIQFHEAHYEGEFTPVGLTPTIFYPGSLGGIDWGGVTVDETRHLLIVNTNDVPWMAQFMPRKLDPNPYMPQAGTPYTIRKHWAFMGPLTVPCGQPPWGQLAAVDLSTNKIIWRHAVGTARDSGPFKWKLPIPLPIGAMNFGGTMATASGLVFMGATMDNYIRAFDVRTGRELWRARLPAGGQAMPMTYMAGGKQYVVITAGGHGRIGTTVGDYTIAYTLPDAK